MALKPLIQSQSKVNQLNPRQKEAVHYISGPLLVLAGAGSGKTSVITRKIAYLIETCGIEARHIAAVTFTNKASREMKERVMQLVKGKASRGLTVSTFHNLGLNIIRKEHKTLGFKPGFSIFDTQDAQSLIKELLIQGDNLDSDQVELIQNTISKLKNDLISPAQAIQEASSPSEMTMAQIYQRYDQSLRAYNAVDFDDLILIPVKLFMEHPAILEKWQNRIRYLLVDEYQDTNSCQYELVKLLVGMRGALTVVGDDDQSIYSWRGARPENLAQLQVDYPGLKLVKLEQNYRSTSRILRNANILIDNNPHIYDKKLWSELGEGALIRVIRNKNEEVEAERVVTEIIDQRLKQGSKFKDYAILYRGNHQARLLELKLQHHQIPYHINGGISFFSRSEVKDIMAYLRLLINPDDDNALLRIINVPRRKIGPSTLQALGSYATERHISLYSAIDEAGIEACLPEKNLERLRSFVKWMDNIKGLCESGDPVTAIREMIDDINYEAWLHQNSSNANVAEKRMGNIHYLIDALQQSRERDQEEDGEGDIKDAIAKLVLRDLLERQEEEDDADKVQLLTLHASKGLEYPHVFMIGMEEELLPHRNSIEEGNIEEERRLAYVGITRAQKTLVLTMAAKRKQFGEIIDTIPSRFLDELTAEDLQWEGLGEQSREINQERGNATIAGLRNLFD
jgi:ATP-dependent DNA helicase Rep